MGYLVNARSTRVGWFDTWRDSWFSIALYYSEYLHYFLRMRLFLVYLFYAKSPWDRSGLIFSHFEIVKSYKIVRVYAFVYVAYVELILPDFFDSYLKVVKKLRRSRKFVYRPSLFFSWIFLRIYQLFGVFDFGGFSYTSVVDYVDKNLTWSQKVRGRQRAAKLLKKLRRSKKCKISPLGSLFYKLPFIFMRNKLAFRGFISKLRFKKLRTEYMRAFFIHHFVVSGYKKMSPNSRNGKGMNLAFWNSLFVTLLCVKIYKGFFNWYREYLIFIFKKLTSLSNFAISFIFLGNTGVTSVFLSRYIARKLTQNFGLREVLNPLREEFAFQTRVQMIKPLKYWRRVASYSSKRESTFFLNVWLHLLFVYSKWYDKHLNIHYNIVGLFSTVGDVLLASDFCIDNTVDGLVQLGWVYRRYHGFIVLVFSKLPVWAFSFLEKFDVQKVINLGCVVVVGVERLFVQRFLFYDVENQPSYSAKMIRSINLHMQRVLRFRYWFFNYGALSSRLRKVHRLSEFNRNSFVNSGILGYKLQLCGRFSRKQRASSYWLSCGRVPLNTYSVNVDYGFFTVPLRNSALTVKVWFTRPYAKPSHKLF